jgi:hypothetical protein
MWHVICQIISFIAVYVLHIQNSSKLAVRNDADYSICNLYLIGKLGTLMLGITIILGHRKHA